MIAHFLCYLALVSTITKQNKKKNVIRVGPPLAKLSGSAYGSICLPREVRCTCSQNDPSGLTNRQLESSPYHPSL